MATYRKLNAAWPDNCPVPTPQEALSGARRLVRYGYRLAREDGLPVNYRGGTFKLTSGNRHTWTHRGAWMVNPNRRDGFGGWRSLVHGISHRLHHRFWPSDDGHSARHAWFENELAAYAIKNFLDGQLKRPERMKEKPDPVTTRCERVTAAIKRWEVKKRRAENALRKLRKQERYYGRRIGHPGIPATATAV